MVKHRRIYTILLTLLLFIATRAYAYQQIEFIKEIGDPSKPDQRLFNSPRAVAAAGDRIFIADTDANRVLVLDEKTGKTVLAWGDKGIKPGQFKSPSGIAVDEKGRIYVSDTGNHRIQVFDANGKLLRAFGAKGDGARQFNDPMGLVASRGLLYVADTGNGRILILTYDSIAVSKIAVKAKTDEMKSPVDVAVDVQNRIYALDSANNNVRIFDHAGAQLGKFGAKGKGVEGFSKPQAIAVDDRGNIFVTDTGNYKVKKFGRDGKLLGSFGTEGDGPGQFRSVSGLDVDNEGRVSVLDSDKNTLQMFSCEFGDSQPLAPSSPLTIVESTKQVRGDVRAVAVEKRLWGLTVETLMTLGAEDVKSIGIAGMGPGRLDKPRGVVVDSRGAFIVADTGNDRLQKFSPEGDLLQVIGKGGSADGEFRSPSGVALTARGNICVADTGNRRVQVFSAKGVFLGAFGKSGKLRGQFSEPVSVAVDGADNIYVADRGNDKIAKYDGNGSLIWETGKAGAGDGEFSKPENIIVSPDGEVYVLDSGNARIQAFNADGKFLWKFGSEGKDAGEFKEPMGLALESGIRLYVGDRGNSRVQAFTIRHTAAVPKDVSAKAGMNEIQLSWKANTETYLEQYRIYRSESPSGPFTTVANAAEPFYIDRNLPSNRAFHYRVSSLAWEGNESASSTVVSAVTPKLVPSQPKKVKIEALEKQITLSWLPNTEPFVANYRVYRTTQLAAGFELLIKAEKTVFIDSPLSDETYYYYQITAVGKDGDESPPSEVVFASTPKASLTLPPLEIAKVELGEIFASAYKHYESNPLGKAVIKNNTLSTFPTVKLSFSIKEFMDYPTEIQIPEIKGGQQMEFALKPVFNNKILGVTENTPLQSEIALTYYMSGEPKTVARSFPLTLYERHAMTWDRKEKIGAFVTPKDTVIADFSRSVIQQYVDAYPNLPQPIVYARALYGALGVYGLSYIVDPTSPFQQFSENASVVDYLQYPRDTLSRKSGDCDDLTILFASSLENIGIPTALVDVPGHVFIMFNTGVSEKDKKSLGFPDEQLVMHGGTIWLPVEMTIVGTSFTKAWQRGAEEYREWSDKKKVEVIDIQKSWEQFKPVTLPPADVKSVKVKRDEIEAKYKGELDELAAQRLALLSADYTALLKKDPNNLNALSDLGMLYGENGLYAEALEQFQKILTVEKENPSALNNIGNINFLQGRFDDARTAYEAALKTSPEDAGIMVNLARALSRAGRKEEAKKWFQEAAARDPRVLRQYSDMAAGMGVK